MTELKQADKICSQSGNHNSGCYFILILWKSCNCLQRKSKQTGKKGKNQRAFHLPRCSKSICNTKEVSLTEQLWKYCLESIYDEAIRTDVFPTLHCQVKYFCGHLWRAGRQALASMLVHLRRYARKRLFIKPNDLTNVERFSICKDFRIPDNVMGKITSIHLT